MQRAAGWIAFGQTVHDALSARRGYATPHSVIPPGVDVVRFRPDPAAGAAVRRRLGWPDAARVVGFLGRFVPQKGLGDLMAALAQMRTPWHALFVGGGPMLAELDAFAKRHQGQVQMIRWRRARRGAGMAQRHVGAVRAEPNDRAVEGAVRTHVDRGDGVWHSHRRQQQRRDARVIGGAGRILPEGEPTAWASALDTLLDDRAALAEMSRRGRERAESAFAWPVVARRHLAFFDALLSTKGTA